METWDAIRARRNVRQYTDRPIAEADLEQILEAAGRRRRATGSRGTSSSSGNATTSSSWPRRGRGAARTSPGRPRRSAWSPRSRRTPCTGTGVYDFGQGTALMMLAATDLGIGSGHAAVVDQEQARKVLVFPDGYWCVYLIGFGHPADRPLQPIEHPDRRAFGDVVHWNRW